jgi:hypothetical protein
VFLHQHQHALVSYQLLVVRAVCRPSPGRNFSVPIQHKSFTLVVGDLIG